MRNKNNIGIDGKVEDNLNKKQLNICVNDKSDIQENNKVRISEKDKSDMHENETIRMSEKDKSDMYGNETIRMSEKDKSDMHENEMIRMSEKDKSDMSENEQSYMKEKGKVWLVGAGPSDVNLLTVKAKELIESADIIVYDSLVGDAVLSLIPVQTTCIDVGKRAGNHTKTQEEINRILCDEALRGKKVVRLKGGDPFVFGRGGEELELLVKNNIEFEIVPGVTSAVAVAAYNGIPVTHRDFVSSLHIITGHKKKNEELDLPFEALVNTNGTLVFLMGLSALPFIMKGLIEAGMDKNMPAAVLQQGTTSKQKKVISTISNITSDVEKAEIHTPAIIVVGKVCSLSDKFEWYEKMPLFGKKMLVTRPKDRSSALASKLRKLGAEVVEIPAIKTVEIDINENIQSVYANIRDYNYILFTSPFGVKVFLGQLRKLNIDIRRIGDARIGAIGSATKTALNEAGLMVDIIPKVYSAKELGKYVAEVCTDADKILIPRAEIGSPDLIEELNKCGAAITDLAIYRTIKNHNENDIYEKLLAEKEIMADNCYVLFTSASTVEGFVDMAGKKDYNKVKAICIGEQTKAAADKYNMKTYVSDKATIDSMVELALSDI